MGNRKETAKHCIQLNLFFCKATIYSFFIKQMHNMPNNKFRRREQTMRMENT